MCVTLAPIITTICAVYNTTFHWDKNASYIQADFNADERIKSNQMQKTRDYQRKYEMLSEIAL